MPPPLPLPALVACALGLAPSRSLAAQGAPTPVDISQEGPCKAALERYCAHVEAGSARKAHCLRSQSLAAQERKESPLPKDCTLALHRFFSESLRNGTIAEPVEGFSEACASDTQELCPGKSGPDLLNCLKRSKLKGKLSAKCQEKVLEAQIHEARHIDLDAKFMEACGEDLQRIKPCNALPALAKPGAKKACLSQHKKSLGDTCRSALFHRMKSDLSDARLNQALLHACKAEITTFCGAVPFGHARVLDCLWEKQNEANFGHACRQKVRGVTGLRVSDYRLNVRIRKHCAHDINKLCAEQKRRVKVQSGEQPEAEQAVLQCLLNNYTKISKASCKPEIQRLVRVHSEAPETDTVFLYKCKADIDRFCNKTLPERVHLCVRNQMGRLTPECASAELLQGSLAAMDISMKPLMKRVCSQAIPKYCAGLPHGDAQIIQCLQDHIEESGLGSLCREVVEEDLQASNHDWRLKYGVHHTCMLDANRLCADKLGQPGPKVLICLKSNYTRISTQSCKAEMQRFIFQGAANIKFAPGTYAACIKDVKSLCPDVSPGQHRIHHCLMSHRAQLSQPCARTEFLEQQLQAAHIETNQKAVLACGKSMGLLCKDVALGEGRKWKCLSEKKDDTHMAPACRAVVTLQERLQNFEFHLNPQMSRHCKQDAATFCPAEAALADFKDFSSEADVVGCLIQQRKSVRSEDCRAELIEKMLQRLENIQNAPDAVAQCKEDIHTFCSNVTGNQGDSAVHKCLQRHLGDLSPKCRMVEVSYMIMFTQAAQVMPFMHKKCSAARSRFCSNAPPGDGHVIACMLQHVHDTGMDELCRSDLLQLQRTRAADLRFNPLLASHCQKDLAEIQRKHPSEVACQRQDGETGGLSPLGINCLTEHHLEVAGTECKSALQNVLKQQSNDVRAKPMMQQICAVDIAGLCWGVEAGKGRLHQCMRQHIKSIYSTKCKAMVISVWEVEKHDITLNPRVSGRCQNEIRSFCPDVEHGGARVLACLLQHEKMQGFGAGCVVVLREVGANATITTATRHAEQEAKKLITSLLHYRSFWDRWGFVLVGGIAVLLLIWITGIVFIIRRLRGGKGLYGVQIDEPEHVTADPEKPKGYPEGI